MEKFATDARMGEQSLQRKLCCSVDDYSARDPEVLTKLPDARISEELGGLPLAVYPSEANNNPGTHVHTEWVCRMEPREAELGLAVLLTTSQPACCGWTFPADPVADNSTAVRVLGWDAVEWEDLSSSAPTTSTSGVAASPLVVRRPELVWHPPESRCQMVVLTFPPES